VKVEFKRRIKPMKVNVLIDQGHPLFIGKLLSSEARHEHNKVGNRVQQIENHLEPPLISLNSQYAGAAVRLVLYGFGQRRDAARPIFILWRIFSDRRTNYRFHYLILVTSLRMLPHVSIRKEQHNE
jgi:hypothetical protein